MGTRDDYEAAIGAVITRFNDVEVALIDLIAGMVGDETKGEAIGWAIGFEQKLRVVVALAKTHNLPAGASDRLARALKEPRRLSDDVRNQVAHAELWENPFDYSVGFRKGTVHLKHGFRADHPEWTVEKLAAKAGEIADVAAELRAIRAVFEFEAVGGT